MCSIYPPFANCEKSLASCFGAFGAASPAESKSTLKICKTAEPTTTNKKKASKKGPTTGFSAFLTLAPDLPLLIASVLVLRPLVLGIG